MPRDTATRPAADCVVKCNIKNEYHCVFVCARLDSAIAVLATNTLDEPHHLLRLLNLNF